MSKPRLQVIAVGDISFNGGYHRLLERRGPGFPTRLLSPMWAAADLRVGVPGIAARRMGQPRVKPCELTLRAAPRALENLAWAGMD